MDEAAVEAVGGVEALAAGGSAVEAAGGAEGGQAARLDGADAEALEVEDGAVDGVGVGGAEDFVDLAGLDSVGLA